MATFRKPYNTDYVGLYENARKYHEEGYRQNAEAQMANAKRNDETWRKLANFSTTAGGWAKEIQKKNEVADAAEYKIIEILSMIDKDEKEALNENNRLSKLIKATEEDEKNFNALGKEDLIELGYRLDNGVNYETASNLGYTDGVKSRLIGLHKLDLAFQETAGLMDVLNDPTQTWQMQGSANEFRLDDKATSSEWKYAYITQLKKMLSHPDIAESSAVDALPYIMNIGKNYMAFEKAVQTKVNYHQGMGDKNLWWDHYVINGKGNGIAEWVEHAKHTSDEKGNKLGYEGAYAELKTRLKNPILNAPLDTNDGNIAFKKAEDLIKGEIPEGYKGAGKSFAEEYKSNLGEKGLLRELQEVHSSWRSKRSNYMTPLMKDMLEEEMGKLEAKNAGVKEYLELQKNILAGENADFVNFTPLTDKISALLARPGRVSPEIQAEAKYTLDTAPYIDLDIHQGLIDLLPHNEQGAYVAAGNRWKTSTQDQNYENGIKTIKSMTITPGSVGILKEAEQFNNQDITNLYRLKHWQLTEANELKQLTSLEIHEQALAYAKGIYEAGTVDSQGNELLGDFDEEGGKITEMRQPPGEYVPIINPALANYYEVEVGTNLAMKRGSHQAIRDHERTLLIRKNQYIAKAAHGDALLTNGKLFDKETIKNWDIFNTRTEEIRSAARMFNMPVGHFINHVRKVNGEEPIPGLPEMYYGKESRLVALYPSAEHSINYCKRVIEVSKEQGKSLDVFDLAPTAFAEFFREKVPLAQHGAFCAIAETLGGLYELHSDDVQAYSEIMDIFTQNSEFLNEWIDPKLLYKWGVSEEMPKRPAFQN
jgi:hypothetical protein